MYMKTRSLAVNVKVVTILHSGNKFKPLQDFSPDLLPTTKQAVCQVINEGSFLKYEVARRVAKELVQLWTWCCVYTISTPSGD